MHKPLILLFVLFLSSGIFAQSIQLPKPNLKKRTLTVMQAYKERHSERTFNSRQLSSQDLSDLLWAAQGVNRENGNLTMPSCMNKQEIRIYVFDKREVSLYDPQTHSLKKISHGDYRHLVADRQEFVMEAPVSLVLVGDLDKMGNDDQRTREMVCVDAGICTQNICLFCSAAGLSTVPRASMNHKEIHRVLKLTNGQIPIMNTPVGYPKR